MQLTYLRIPFLVLLLFASVDIEAQNINKPNIIGPAGLEVNSYTGSLYTKRTDLYIPCRGIPINITFSYNSANTAIDIGYGPGWYTAWSMDVKIEGANATVRREDGRRDIFTFNGIGYAAPVGIFDTLIRYQPGKFKLQTKNGFNYFFDDSTHHRLTSVVDLNNNTLILSYTDSLPTTITDPSGRSVMLSYTAGHLTQITDANFIPARTITYQYDSDKNPVTVNDPLGNSIHYNYDAIRNMILFTDQLGNNFNISYNNCTSVQTITSPLNSLNISFDTVQLECTMTEMVNSIMQSTSYLYDVAGNLKEKTGTCCGFHQLYNYDSNKNMIKKTDANGNVYNYAYSLKGNLISETDPLSTTAYSTYEPVYSRVTSTTDKRGFTTNYTYDANGNLLQVQKPLGITETNAYDSNGNLISHTNGRGFTTSFGYNAHGDMILVTFPGGATNLFTYDNVGNLLTATDANGNTTMHSYDMLNRIIQSTNALAHSKTFAYDARGDLLSTTDALAHVNSYTYDALKRRTSMTTPAGISYSTYDEYGNMLTAKDNNGNITHYFYDTRNLLITETDALSHSRNFTYDANGNKISETDFNGNLTTYTYDARNRKIKDVDALGNNTTYAYDANNNKISEKDANNHTTSYVYDALNRTVQMQRPIGSISYQYDANNNRISITDPLSHSTAMSYDNRDRLISTTDALGHSETNTYDPQGNRVSMIDRNAHTTTYIYDALNRNIARSNPLGETASIVYDAVGREASRTSPGGNIITNSFDAADRLVSSSDLNGIISSYTYDANSNLLSQTDALGHAISYVYDALNRKTSITDALAQVTTFVYDNNFNILISTDRNGHSTSCQYDALNRKIKTTYPVGNIDQTAYDAVGNIITRTDDNGQVTAYLYDANDRNTRETKSDGSQKNYSYDAADNLISRVDFNGNTTQYTYNALDRLTARNYPGTNDDFFSFDNEGNLLTAVNSNASITFVYDNADRTISENLNGKTTLYTYDIPNRKRTLTYPGGRGIEEDYDFRMRLNVVKDNSSTLVNYTYDAADRQLSRTYSNGISTTYSYNNNDWVTNLNHSGIAQFNYSFDNEGNRLFAEKSHYSTNSEKYVYDNDDRLINYEEGTLIGGNISSPITQTQYNYDGAGNRTSIVHDATTTLYTTNAINEYTNISDSVNTNPTYDANGNSLFDGHHNYLFDFENRLTAADLGSTALYKYDALGRRIRKQTTTETMNYYYDENRIIEERNAADATVATYVYGTRIDDILNMKRNGNNYFYHHNSLGSVAAISDNSGIPVERYEYDAYGKPTIYNGTYSLLVASAIGNSYMFTGREYDAETGNYHYRTRFYNPDWGRFGQEDRLVNRMYINKFLYTGNRPVNYIDPLGLEEKKKDDEIWGNKELKWEDFKGKTPADTRGLDAETYYTFLKSNTGKEVENATQNGTSEECKECWTCEYSTPEYEVKAVFDKNKSWKKGKGTAALLKHEQGHFDIANHHAKKFQDAARKVVGKGAGCSKAEACRKAKTDWGKQKQKLFEQTIADDNKMQEDYDTETNHGTKDKEQKEWNEKIGKLDK